MILRYAAEFLHLHCGSICGNGSVTCFIHAWRCLLLFFSMVRDCFKASYVKNGGVCFFLFSYLAPMHSCPLAAPVVQRTKGLYHADVISRQIWGWN